MFNLSVMSLIIMKDNMTKASFLVILSTLSFQLCAEKINSQVNSNNNRLDKLELGVAELGAERERARKIRPGTYNDTKIRHKFINLDDKTVQNISNTKKLELSVAELGAKRERARKIRPGTYNDTKIRHKFINLDDKTVLIISNTKKLEPSVAELGAERERIRAQKQDKKIYQIDTKSK